MKENNIQPQQQQQQVLTELGNQLYQIRCQQGISLAEVARKTCIRATLLKAIEQGKLDALPEAIYVQGFIKQFAEVLGLDGDKFARTFPCNQEDSLPKSNWWHLPFIQLRPVHLYLLYIVMVVAAVSSLSHLVQRSTIQASNESLNIPTQPVPNSSPTVEEVTLPGNQIPVVAQNAVVSSSKQEDTLVKPVVVGIALRDRSWVKITIDGKTQFEGVLEDGEKRIWKADKELTIRAGNAGGVLVTFNDQQTKQLGQNGQVRQVTYAYNQ